jgi:colanic acid biosynthesis glycosyl transferase WcaI
MRLAVYSHNYAPEPIGIPFYNTSMCRWFVERLGWQVTVRTGMPHYPWWKVPEEYAARDYSHGRADEVIDGVVVERVRHYVPAPPPSCLARMRMDLSWLLRVAWRSLRTSERPDAVLLIAPPFLLGALGLLLRLRWRVPVVYHIQDLQCDAALELKMMPQALAAALLASERLIIANVDQVTTISAGMRARIAAKVAAPDTIGMFPNWIDEREMRAWTRPNRYRAQWDIPRDGLVAMYSGNLGRKQGLEVLIAAAARLPRQITVVIAGAGGERAQLERLAEETAPGRVRFCDLVELADLPEFLSAADLHCVVQRPAASGTVMPSKMLNIMAVERPVVVTAEPGTDLANTVAASGAGVAVAPEDPAALAAAIAALAADPARRAGMGASARAWVVENYGIDQVLGRFAARLELLVARQRNRDRVTSTASLQAAAAALRQAFAFAQSRPALAASAPVPAQALPLPAPSPAPVPQPAPLRLPLPVPLRPLPSAVPAGRGAGRPLRKALRPGTPARHRRPATRR